MKSFYKAPSSYETLPSVVQAMKSVSGPGKSA